MSATFEGKHIILSAPNHFGLLKRFGDALQKMGFHVILLPDSTEKNIGIKDTLIHGYKKFFRKDSTHKAIKKAELSEDEKIDFIKNLSQDIDFALLIRPDLLSEKVVRAITAKAKYSVAYQWDGMDRFPTAKNYIQYFDKFLVFDQRDSLQFPECTFTTNFYFDDVQSDAKSTAKSAFFVGTFMEDRWQILNEITRKLEELGYAIDFFVKAKSSKRKKLHPKIRLVEKGLTFEDNLRLLQQASVVIDIKNNIHHGLSLRTFEAVGYRKKLITNNSLVKDFDFYHPDNIFLIENNAVGDLEQFLTKPYKNLSGTIREKYSFSAWIERALAKN